MVVHKGFQLSDKFNIHLLFPGCPFLDTTPGQESLFIVVSEEVEVLVKIVVELEALTANGALTDITDCPWHVGLCWLDTFQNQC